MNRIAKALRNPAKAVDRVARRCRSMFPESARKVEADAGQFWTRSQDDVATQALSHWRGQGYITEEFWQATGRRHLALLDRLCLLAGRTRPIRAMLEWGSGGGANACAFAQRVTTFYGVDISAPNLEEVGRQLAPSGFAGWKPLLVDVHEPESVRQRGVEPLDLFLCVAVYQHFPSKEYGLRVTRVAHDLLAADGLAIIQTRIDDGSERLSAKTKNYSKDAIVFTSYRVEEFWNELSRAGFSPLAVVLDPESAYAFYLAEKTREV